MSYPRGIKGAKPRGIPSVAQMVRAEELRRREKRKARAQRKVRTQRKS